MRLIDSRRPAAFLAGIALALLLGLCALAPTASADIVFGDVQGHGAGQLSNPQSIAVDFETGELFVAEGFNAEVDNARVSVFDQNGNFLRAFGWGVDTGAEALEVCTQASGCQQGIPGSGAGQLNGFEPNIAVDNDPLSPSYHDVFVYDNVNFRVQRFTAAGAFVLTFGDGVNQTTGGDVCTALSGDTCGTGTEGFGPGQFSGFAKVALGAGTVHVADCTNCKGGPGGTRRVQTFEPSGTLIGQPLTVSDGASGWPVGLAADSGGDFYLSSSSVFGVRRYDSSGNPLATIGSGQQIPLALAASGHLFVADRSLGKTALAEYDSAGIPQRVHYGNGTLKSKIASLAPHTSADGDIFALESSSPRRLAHIKFEPPGPVVLPFAAQAGDSQFTINNSDTKATEIGNLNAQLNARVNPEGKATAVHFEYVDDASYQSEGGFASPNTETTGPAQPNPLPGDFAPHNASFAIACPDPEVELPEGKCLKAQTLYHFRAIATNADGTDTGPEATYETLPPIQFGNAWSSEVGNDSARLHAEVNPTGLPATVRFEYVEQGKFESSGFSEATQSGEIGLGSGSAATSRSIVIESLSPGTTYRFRYVATNFFGEFSGPERSFATFPVPPPPNACPNQSFRTGPSARLPDCRAYEMVSPLDKENGDILSVPELGSLAMGGLPLTHVNQASPGGEKVTYSSYRAFGDAISTPFSSQYIASRDPASGWSTHSINPPQEGPPLSGVMTESIYKGFSEDLCSAWLIQNTDVAMAEGAPPGVPNLYRRTNCGEEGYELLTTVPPPGFDKSEIVGAYWPSTQGFSADGTCSVFKAPAKLTPDANEGDIFQVYLHSSNLLFPSQLRLVSVLPGGEAVPTHASIGTSLNQARKRLYDSVAGAVSADCSRVFWSAEVKEPSEGIHKSLQVGFDSSALYLRLNATEEQSAFSTVTGIGDVFKDSNEVKGLEAAKGNGTLGAGSNEVTSVATTAGQFVVGQPISGTGIPNGTTITAVSGTTLTLSANATASGTGVALLSKGPLPFAVGQSISGEGIPPKTTIIAVAEGTLTLSADATATKFNAALATRSCGEPAKACTIPVSKGIAHFYAADSQGTKALYSKGGNLYEFDVAKAIANEAEASRLVAGGLKGVTGWSEDLGRVYLVSGQVCSGETQNSEGDKAQAGKANLYLYEAGEECGTGEMTFVATLGGVGVDEVSYARQPVNRRARVSADGMHAAFMSKEPLTGYDNIDVESGQPDTEVFLYDAAEAQLRCVSCNPSGGRPRGRRVKDLLLEPWIGARIPGWENVWHAPRVLSEDGERLFFESFDTLVPRDTNGLQDVYEWQQASNAKECEEAGAELFSPEAGGCISLISSGKSDKDSEFVDASADGSDVFFTSASSLVPQDYGLIDIYDARVEGGFPPPPEPDPPCEGESCQSPSAPPRPQTPSSLSFKGAGNLAQPGKARPRCPKGKRRVVRRGKPACVKKRKGSRKGRAGR